VDGTITSSLAVNTDPAGNSFTPVAGNTVTLDRDFGEQAALKLTVGNTDIGAGAASAVPFTIAGLDAEDTGTVTFTDHNGKSVQVSVNGGTNYSANLTTLADGTITSSLAVNTDPAGNSFTPVAGTTVTLDQNLRTDLTTLVTFNNIDGSYPTCEGLIADANGDLFGTTEYGGLGGYGTVFEIAKTNTGYASAPVTLVNFNNGNGENPIGSLIADANGDLFGTTQGGGASGYGTVFEIAKTNTGYASAPTTLVSFNIGNGAYPQGSLIADANGDLFGTTGNGGSGGYGTVFEIAKTNTGYASAPTTLVSFNNENGASPAGSLITDANGDLFGTLGSTTSSLSSATRL
jgi:uncharacterized repeat protein (TIGR03803 family)